MFKKKYLIVFLIAAFSCSNNDNQFNNNDNQLNIEKSKITNLNKEIFYPLFANALPNVSKYLGYQPNKLDYVNYFITSGIALEYLIKSLENPSDEKIKKSLEILDNIEKTFDNHGYFPRPEYHNYKSGWSSSMDAPMISLTSLVAFEITGNEKYYNFYKKLIPYLSKTNNEKGFLLKLEEDAIFPLEYCDLNSTEDNALFVLNGSLVGYLSLSIIAKTYKNKEILILLDKINRAYEDKFNEYVRDDKLWTFYKLNKLTSNQGHYHIFEMKLLSSIYSITNNKFFKNEYELRKDMLKEIYDLKVEDMKDSLRYYFLRAAAPQPYVIELYETILRFYDKNNNLIHQDHCQKSGYIKINEFRNNAFMIGTIPKKTYKYELISVKGKIETILFSEKIDDYVSNFNPKKIDFNLVASDDAKLKNKKISLCQKNSEKEWASIVLKLNNSIDLDYEKYYFIEINNGIDNTIMQLTLYDDNGKNLHRYFPKMIEGKNLLLFSPLGFHSNQKIHEINKIRLKINTKNKRFIKEKNIELNGFGVLKNEYEVIKYLSKTEFKINSELN